MGTRLEKATKAFERGIGTNFPGEREACRRACLRLIAAELGVTFDPDVKIDPVELWGVKVQRPDMHIVSVS